MSDESDGAGKFPPGWTVVQVPLVKVDKVEWVKSNDDGTVDRQRFPIDHAKDTGLP